MVLRVNTLSKSYIQGDKSLLHVLNKVELNLDLAQSVAIMGESGSGKTTLLNCISGLDNFDSGSVLITGKNIATMKDIKLAELRNKALGFVFQFHYLLKDFTVLENVMIPCLISGLKQSVAQKKASNILDMIELSSKKNNFPMQLSGGEQQRVAIARALVMEPRLLLMDEPTGNLDERLTDEVMNYVKLLCGEIKTAIVIATHNKKVANMMDRTYVLKSGQLVLNGGNVE